MMGDLPKRKPNRLKNADYSAPGAYFVTFCVKNKEPLLGEIVGDGTCDVPQMRLSPQGQIVEKRLLWLCERRPALRLENYIIMPNHVHLLLSISADPPTVNGSSQAPTPTNNAISSFVSQLKRDCGRELGESIWQRSFYDHIVRNDTDYWNIWDYIDTNILRWERDRFYSK